MTDFAKIMEGFVQAQIKGGADGGLEYLNGVNAALESQLEKPESTVAYAAGNGACQSRSFK